MNAISSFFGMIFDWINGLTGNYGLSIILFTILFRLVLSPLDIRSRVGQWEYTAKMKKIQPEIDELQKTYKNNPEKAQAKIMEVRKREKIGLMPKGCGAMLLTYPILLAFFAVFRNLAAEHLAELSQMTSETEIAGWFSENSFLWIKNIWQPDTLVNFSETWGLRKIILIKGIDGYILPKDAVAVQAVLQSAFKGGMLDKFNPDGLTELAEFATVINTNLEAARAYVAEHFSTGTLIGGNGYYIFPILAGAVQVFSFNMTTPNQPESTDPQAQQAAGMSKIMKIFFPAMFVYFCLVSSTALALYWITSSLCMIVLNLIVNSYLKKRDAKQNMIIEGEKK